MLKPRILPFFRPPVNCCTSCTGSKDVTALVRASELGEQLRGQQSAMEREVIQRSHELADTALREVREANVKLADLDVAKTAFFQQHQPRVSEHRLR